MVVEVIAGDHADQQDDRLFHALADTTRRDIVALVLQEGHSVSSLARRYPMSVTAVQKHVAVLELAGLVTKQRRGREQIVRGRIEGLRQAHRLLDQYEDLWRQRVARMENLLTEGDDT